MNVNEQGPGGLLMLFASGAALFHLAELSPRLAGTDCHAPWVLGLFLLALVFLGLGLMKRLWWRNGIAFALGAALVVALHGVKTTVVAGETLVVRGIAYAKDHGRYANRELASDYAAAVRMWNGTNPYAGAAGTPTDALRDPLGFDPLGASPLPGDPWKPKDAPKPPEAPTAAPIALALHQGEAVKGPFERPAGAFLVWVPMVALDPDQTFDPRWVQVGLLLLTCLLLGTALGRQFFLLPLLLVLSLPTYADQLLDGRTHFAWLLFMTMAWVVSPHRYVSGLLAGLACAIDPTAWFVALFLVAITAREKDSTTALLQLLALLFAFVAVNGYWIYDNPEDWLAAIGTGLGSTVQAADSIGLVFLESQGWVTTLAANDPSAYWMLVAVIELLLLVVYLLFPAPLYAMGPVLGVVPLWAFFRSPAALFELLPLLALAGWTSARIFPPSERFAEPAARSVRYA